MTVPFATLSQGYPFAYRPFYVLETDGVPYLFATLPGVTLNSDTHEAAAGTLIVDRGAKIGPVLPDKSNLGAALDLEVRLADPEGTSVIADLMARPTHMTVLTEDIAYNATSLPVASTAGFQNEPLYWGMSCSQFGGELFTSFPSIDSTPYGTPHAYKAGLIVGNRPRKWQGRRVRLWELVVSPIGTVVQGASDWKQYATCRWDGFIQSRPIRTKGIWGFTCRDSLRRLSQPLGAVATGKAKWSLDDDGLILLDRDSTVKIDAVQHTNTTSVHTLTSYTLTPFTGLPSPSRKSAQRAALTAAWKAAVVADGDYADTSADLTWEQVAHEAYGSGGRRWKPRVVVDLANGGWLDLTCTFQGRWDGFQHTNGTKTTNVASGLAEALFWQASSVIGASVRMTLDDGDSSVVPPSGWVRLTVDENTDYVAYTSWTSDPNDSSVVYLHVDPLDQRTLNAYADAEGTDEEVEYTADIVWRDTGLVPDALRRAIASTGYGVNGTYDTLASGQGYGLSNLDEASFDEVFDGPFTTMPLQLAAEGGTSVQDTIDGLLMLSSRAIVSRRASDGSGVNIAAVRVGSADSGVPVATITDADLVASQGQKPVRIKKTFAAPQIIKCTLHTIPIAGQEAGEAKETFVDEHLTDWTTESWDLDIYGIDPAALAAAGVGWSLGIFRGAENRQLFEMDTGPHIDAQIGDLVYVDSRDKNLWDYADGTPGYTGLARCLGAQGSLDSANQTYLFSADGVASSGPMCPSLPILAVNGTATSPTSIDVDEDCYELLNWVSSSGFMYIVCYLPGSDDPHGVYTITTIAKTAGVCRMTVSGYPSSPTVSLSTSYRVTWPIQQSCTEHQRPYLHNTDQVQWA